MLRAQGGSVHRVGSIIGTVVCIESAGLIVFSPTMYGTSDLALQLGDCVRLKDWDDGFGEGLVTGLTETNITIGNLSPSLQVPLLILLIQATLTLYSCPMYKLALQDPMTTTSTSLC